MYNKPFKIWDDSWDIHKSGNDSYSSNSKYGSITGDEQHPVGYNEAKYGSGVGSGSSVYNSSKASQDDEAKEKAAEHEDTLQSVVNKEAKRDEKAAEDSIIARAAGEVLAESKKEQQGNAKTSNKKSIEEAINEAISQEKEVIVLN